MQLRLFSGAAYDLSPACWAVDYFQFVGEYDCSGAALSFGNCAKPREVRVGWVGRIFE
jgi:hypothetical protein